MRFFSSAEPATGSFVWMPDNYLHKKDEGALIFCDILVFSASYLFILFLSFRYSSGVHFVGHGFLKFLFFQ